MLHDNMIRDNHKFKSYAMHSCSVVLPIEGLLRKNLPYCKTPQRYAIIASTRCIDPILGEYLRSAAIVSNAQLAQGFDRKYRSPCTICRIFKRYPSQGSKKENL